MDWKGLRTEFPLLRDVAYFNSCSQGALSNRVAAAIGEYVRSWREEGSPWEKWMGIVARSRESFGRLISTDPSEVSLHGSYTAAQDAFLGAVIAARPEGRDTVLVDGLSFPTVAHSVRAHEPLGIRAVIVDPVDGATGPEVWDRYLDERTLLACVSQVHYETGRLSDAAAICTKVREAGALSLLDVYQGIGTLPVDAAASGADAIATGTLKFLLGTSGLAYLWVRRDLAEELVPPSTGWLGQADPFAMSFDLDPAPRGRRFEGGTWPMPAVYAAAVALPWLCGIGPGRIRERVVELMTFLLEGCGKRGLRTRGPQTAGELGPIVSIAHPDPPAAVTALAQKRILTTPRGGGVRLSLHFYNDESDIDRALDALGEG